MTTPQVFLIMSGLGLLFYVLITGFRSSRKSVSRHHRRQWWMGSIGGTAIALSPLSLFWRKPFNSIDLLTQSLLIAFACMLAMLLFALLLVPFKAARKIFRKKRQNVEYALTRNADGLSPISINAEANTMLDHTPVTAMASSAPLQSIYSTNTSEKSIAETINASGEIHTDIELAEHLKNAESDSQFIEEGYGESLDEQIDQNTDLATGKQLDVSDIESAIRSQGESNGTQQLDDSLSRSGAANDKIDTTRTRNNTKVALENTRHNASRADKSRPDESQRDERNEEVQEDSTLRLDELVDETIQLDELADDTLRLDELLPNGEMPTNSEPTANNEAQANAQQASDQRQVKAEPQSDDEHKTDSELLSNEAPQNEEASQAEEELLAEDGLWAENELDIASIPSDEESFDLSETGDLFSEIRLQQTEVELPDEKELRDANQASADDEKFDLDSALLQASKPEASTDKTSVRVQTEVEEADVIHNDIDLGVDESDLEFGNDLTGEYAHPAEEYELTPEQADKQALETEQTQTIDPVTDHIVEHAAQSTEIEATETTTERVDQRTAGMEPTVKRVARIPEAPAPESNKDRPYSQTRQTEKRVPINDVLVVHNTNKKAAEPKTLAAALVAAKLTAESVETQVTHLEQRIAKLDGVRSASIDSAHTNAEQHTVALEQTSALLTSEDEARRAAESVIAAQKAMLKRAKEQQAELDTLLEQERKHLRLLKSEVERSRKMARTAALLARKAAVAQQEIRSVAKREQTARLKSEESTRKAVNIARNAINALAEEERKRDLTQH